DVREAGDVEPAAAARPAGGLALAGRSGRGTALGLRLVVGLAGATRRGRAAAPRAAAAHDVVAAVIHHDDERLGLALGNQVVHDQRRAALVAPARLVLAGPVLEIQHRVTGARVLVVVGRRVDVAAARGVGGLGEV